MPKATPDITVIVPVYQAERFLAGALDSLVGQTLPASRLRILCVDDGSTDGSPAILARYAERHANLSVITQPNRGCGAAYNAGMDVADTEFVGFLEPDDLMVPGSLELLLGWAAETGADIVKGNYVDHSEDGDRLEEFLSDRDYGHVTNAAQDPTVALVRPSVWSAIYRTDFLRSNRIRFAETPGASFQDTAFAFAAYGSAESVVFIRDGVVRYRIDNAASSVKSTSKLWAIFDEMSAMEAFVNASHERRERLGGALAYKEFSCWEWNCRRLGWGEAAERTRPIMAGRMRKLQDDGFLDRSFFTDAEWGRAQELVAGPMPPLPAAVDEETIREAMRDEVRASASYRLGHAIIEPARKARDTARRLLSRGEAEPMEGPEEGIVPEESPRGHRIVMIGAIANPNVGDEAILERSLRRVDGLFGDDAEVRVLSKDAAYTDRLTQAHACAVTASDALHTISVRCGYDLGKLLGAEEVLLARLRGDETTGEMAYPEMLRLCDEVIAQFDGAELLHVIGGGYLNSMWPHMLFEVHAAMRVAKAGGARVLLTGQGVSPFDADDPVHARLLSEIAAAATFCDFRDGSVTEAKRAVRLSTTMRTADDLATYVEDAPNPEAGDAPYGNVTLVGLLGVASAEEHLEGHRHVIAVLAEFLSQQLSTGAVDHVNLLAFSPGDELLLQALADGTDGDARLLVMHDRPVSEATAIVQGARWNVGERFHQAVLSLAAGVPVASWWHNPYYETKLKSAYEPWGLGASRRCMPGDELTVDRLNAFALEDVLTAVSDAIERARPDVELRMWRKERIVRISYGVA